MALALLWTLPAAAQPAWSGSLTPSTIGPGAASRLQYHVDALAQPVTGLGFSVTLPAGVTVAAAADAINTCGGALLAPSGGSSITLSGVRMAAGSTCDVAVNVTSSTPGATLIPAGSLTSSLGGTGSADTTLTVATDRAALHMAFSPSAVSYRGRSTLTYTIDNSANAGSFMVPRFSHDLGDQLRVASPLRTVNGCGAAGTSTLTADAGSSRIDFLGSAFVLGAGATCTIEVDVEALAVGALETTTGDLAYQTGSAGLAAATLSVPVEDVSLSMMLSDLNAPPGGTFEAAFSVRNFDRDFPATDVAFDLPLDSVLSGLTASVPAGQGCGTGSSLTGGGTLSLSGAELPPEGSCHFVVELTVPGGAAPSSRTLLTSALSAMVDGASVAGLPVQATFEVGGAPTLTVSSSADNVAAGGTFDLTVTLNNPHPVDTATNLAATFDMLQLSETLQITALPSSGFCGGTGNVTGPLVVNNPPAPSDATFDLHMTGVTLAPGASCQFSLEITLAPSTPSGARAFGPLSFGGTLGSSPVIGKIEPAEINLVGGPRLTVSPEPGAHAEGSEVELVLRVEHAEAASSAATGVAFSVDLESALPGLVALDPTQFEVCGIGSTLSGSSTLTFSGGTLVPGQICEVGVTLRVPDGAAGGDYSLLSSDVTSNVGGAAVTSGPAQGTLRVEQGVVMSLAFVEGTASPGETVTARYTLRSLESTNATTDIVFTHQLTNSIPGVVAQVVDSEVCGTGSSLSPVGQNFLMQGGNLGPGESCSFDVVWQLPTSASAGRFTTSITSLSATIGGVATALVVPSTTLVVVEPLDLQVRFSESRVLVGSTVDLTYELTNNSRTLEIDAIAFSNDYETALAGLFGGGLPLSDVCGSGSELAGDTPASGGAADEFSSVAFSGGVLAPGASCAFTIPLQIPQGVPPGALVTNATSAVTASATPPLASAFGLNAAAASDTLRLGVLTVDAVFLTDGVAGETVDLRMTITNGDASQGYDDISVVFDLDSLLPGMVLSGDPPLQPCGAGSSVGGTSVLGLNGASLGAGGSCSFVVQTLLPGDAPPGEASGTPSVEIGGVDDGSDLGTGTTDAGAQDGGAGGSDPPALEGTVVIVVVVPPPTLTRSLSSTTLTLGQTASLEYLVDNARGNVAAGDLSLSDTVPEGLALLPDAVPTSTCTEDIADATVTFTAPDGVSVAGGRVEARGTCRLEVQVEAVTPGSYAWAAATLTSDRGDSRSATTAFEVVDPAVVDAGTPTMDAAVPMDEGGMPADPDAGEGDAGSGPDADAGCEECDADVEITARGGGGCSVGHRAPASHAALGLLGTLLLATWWRRRTRRGRAER